jgi:hypothetical protein
MKFEDSKTIVLFQVFLEEQEIVKNFAIKEISDEF